MANRFVVIGVLIGIALLHAAYVPNGFVWLDHGDIELKRAILTESPWLAGISRFGATSFYRPVVTLVHSVDYYLYNEWAPGYHGTNILLHLAVTALTPYFLSLFIPLQPREKLISMLVVGLHPIGWLPVGVISYRPELLYTLGVMAALVMYTRVRTTGSILHILGFILLTVASFWSKETALVVLPLLIGIWEYNLAKKSVYVHRRLHTHSALRIVVLLCFIYGGYGLLRWFAVPELWSVSAPSLSVADSLGTRLTVGIQLLGQLFLPTLPSLSDATSVVSVFSPLPLAGLMGMGFFCVLTIRKKIPSEWILSSMLMAAALLPAFHIVPAPRFRSSHYAYFAIPITAFIFILILRATKKLFIYRIVVVPLFVCWILVATYSTWMGGARFADDRTVFEPEVTRDPAFREGHQYLGDSYFFAATETDTLALHKAAYHYEQALTPKPGIIAFADTSSVLNNLAGVYLAQNKLTEAEKLLETLWRQQPTPMVLYHRALVAYRQGKYDKALKLLTDDMPAWNHPAARLLQAEILQKIESVTP